MYIHIIYRVGALNHGVTCGSAAVAVEGLWAERLAKPMGGGGPNGSVNVAAGMSGPAVAMEMAYRQITTQSFVPKKNKMKIFEGLSNIKNSLETFKLNASKMVLKKEKCIW